MTSTTVAGGTAPQQQMSQGAMSAQATERPELDEAVARLADRARAFARMPAAEKAAL